MPSITTDPRVAWRCLVTAVFLTMTTFLEATPVTEVPRLESFPGGDFSSAARAMSAASWTMEQTWRASPQDGLRRGTVRFGWTPDALWILADLPDDHVESRSTAHRQRMWELGDVFEIFMARRFSPLYLELHVTPNNHRLHLRWTKKDFAQMRAKKKTLDDFQQDPAAFESWVRRSPQAKGWQVLARLPASLWPDARPFRAGQKLALSFGRYDCGPGGNPKILSSTSPHRELSYHRRHEWRTVVLAPAR
jgi:hypothetical protein